MNNLLNSIILIYLIRYTLETIALILSVIYIMSVEMTAFGFVVLVFVLIALTSKMFKV